LWDLWSKIVSLLQICSQLFQCSTFSTLSLLASEGLSDLKHMSQRPTQQENSVKHMTNMNTWNDLRVRLDKNQTTDEHLQEESMKEKECCRQVLHRIFLYVKCPAKNNLSYVLFYSALLDLVQSSQLFLFNYYFLFCW